MNKIYLLIKLLRISRGNEEAIALIHSKDNRYWVRLVAMTGKSQRSMSSAGSRSNSFLMETG